MGSTAAKLLVDARRQGGLTRTALARRSGIPQSVISAYENGHRDPGTSALTRLLAAVGYRLGLVTERAGIDLGRADRHFREALDLAEALPRRRRGALTFPPLPR